MINTCMDRNSHFTIRNLFFSQKLCVQIRWEKLSIFGCDTPRRIAIPW